MARRNDSKWNVWLPQTTGEVFLGRHISRGSNGETRFCVHGTMKEETSFGVWLKVDVVQEKSIPGNEIIGQWKVKPNLCLIAWRDIAYVQKGNASRGEKIGFDPIPPKEE